MDEFQASPEARGEFSLGLSIIPLQDQLLTISYTVLFTSNRGCEYHSIVCITHCSYEGC